MVGGEWEMGMNVNSFTQAAPSSTSLRDKDGETACSSGEVELRCYKSANFCTEGSYRVYTNIY